MAQQNSTNNIIEALKSGSLPFNETEKNAAAFKGLFGVLNSSTLKREFNNEIFAKSFNVFPEDILSQANQVLSNPLSGDSNILPFQTRTWELSTATSITDTSESLIRGNFTTTPGSNLTANPKVEKIICPLVKVKNTNDQLYFLYGKENIDSTDFSNTFAVPVGSEYGAFEGEPGLLFASQSQILTNFISPFKFGGAYTVKVFESDESFSTFNSSVEVIANHSNVENDPLNKQYGGWVFDYKTGALFIGGINQSGSRFDGNPSPVTGSLPDLSGFRHPLWLVGYRYIGETGGISGTSDVTNATNVSIDFNTDTNVLQVGADTVSLDSLGTSFERITFKNKDFAEANTPLSSSIAIMHDANADGSPYTAQSFESWLLLNTIHLTDHRNIIPFDDTDTSYGKLYPNKGGEFSEGAPHIQFPYGYAIGFSSSLNTPTSSFFPRKHFSQPKSNADQFNIIGTHEPHAHGFNWSYVTSSGATNYYYDPSGKNKATIASELRTFINNNFNDHLSASIETTDINGETIPTLTVHQKFSGFPSWYYTNVSGGIADDITDAGTLELSTNDPLITVGEHYKRSFTNFAGSFLTSSNGNLRNAFGASAYPLRFTASNDIGSGNKRSITFLNDFFKLEEEANNYTNNSYFFFQNIPNTGSATDNGCLTFQKSLFPIDEKTHTGSLNFFNQISGAIQNTFIGDYPDPLFNQFIDTKANVLYASFLGNTYDQNINPQFSSTQFSKGQAFHTPGVILIDSNDNGSPADGKGGFTCLRAGARTTHPSNLARLTAGSGFAGSPGQPLKAGSWGKQALSVLNGNFESLVNRGGLLFPTTIPTGSDLRFGLLEKNKINPSRRTIINHYVNECLKGDMNGMSFGIEFSGIINDDDAIIQLNAGLRSLRDPEDVNILQQPYEAPANFSPPSVNFWYTSSFFNVVDNSADPPVVTTFPINPNFGNSTTTTTLFGQSDASVTTVEIISDVNPTLGGSLNLNQQNITFDGSTTIINSTGEMFPTNLSSSGVISASDLFISNDVTINGDLDLNGTFDFGGFNFIEDNIASLTGSNSFGQTASFNKHTFTGSVIISSSQTPALSIGGNHVSTSFDIEGNITSSGIVSASGIITTNTTITNTLNVETITNVSTTHITSSGNISASGLLFASASLKPNSASLRTVLYDTASGRFYYTGSYGVGSGGEGVGFPFTGSAQITGSMGITGSLSLTGSSPFIQLNSSSINHGFGKLYNFEGDLFWGNTNVAAVGSGITSIVQDTTPQLGGNLDMNSFNIVGTIGDTITLNESNNASLTLTGNSITLVGGGIEAVENSDTKFRNLEVTNNIIQTSNTGKVDIKGAITASNSISASGHLFASLSLAPSHTDPIVAVVYDSSSGQFYYTGSHGGVGGGGTGTGAGFPFSGSALINGTLNIAEAQIGEFGLIDINNQTNNDFINVSLVGNNITTIFNSDELYEMFDGNQSVLSAVSFIGDLDTININIDFNFGGAINSSPIITQVEIDFVGSGHKQIEILGSNDGLSFNSIHEEPTPTDGTDRTINFSNNSSFKIYRLRFKAGQFASNALMTISEIKYYGFPQSSPGLLTTQNIEATSITGSLLGTASFASVAETALSSGDDGDWHIINNVLTSSRDVQISGNLLISQSNSIKINNTRSLAFEGDTLVIGSNTGNDAVTKKIRFEGPFGASVEIDTPTSVGSQGNTKIATNLVVEHDITSSGGINADLDIDNNNLTKIVVYNDKGNSLFFKEASNIETAATSDDDFFIGTRFLTSSKDVQISNSLFVKESITSLLLTSSNAFIQKKLSVGQKIEDVDTSQANLTVRDSLLLFNDNDTNSPKSEGIKITTFGNDGSTGGRIFFQKQNDTAHGVSFVYNPGNTNDILDLPANTFVIKNHKNSANGASAISMDLNNKFVGINNDIPSFPLDVLGDTKLRNKLIVGGSITSSAGILSEGDIHVRGNIFAEQYIVSSSVVHFTQSFSDGSTKFGDTIDDKHEFTGSLTIRGNITGSKNISASGHISASEIHIGGGTFTSESLAAAAAGTDNLGNHTATEDLNLNSNSIKGATNITASGNISASLVIFANQFHSNNKAIASHDPVSNTTVFGTVTNKTQFLGNKIEFFNGPITASNNISASGDIIANTGSFNHISSSGIITMLTASIGGGIFTSASLAAGSSNGTGNGFPYSGSDNQFGNPAQAIITGSLFLSGSGHITASGNISASLFIYANQFYSNNKAVVSHDSASNTTVFSTVTNKTQFLGNEIEFFNGPVKFGSLTEKVNITASGNISASGNIFADLPSNTKPLPPIVYNNLSGNNDVFGRFELSNNVIIGEIFEPQVGGGIIIGGSPDTPPTDHGPIIIRGKRLEISGSGDLIVSKSIDAGRAIIGISGSERLSFNQEKLTNYFDKDDRKYSLYVRNGDTIVGGDIIPDVPSKHSLGTKEFPFKDLHIHESSIIFYSGSSEISGSAKDEIAKITINDATKVVEFKSGSKFNEIHVGEINIGQAASGSTITSSVQIGASGQGFIAVMAEAGKNSTILRAESPTGDFSTRMGSITQKGSGSFAILLDADAIAGSGRPDAKFVVESNSPVPGVLGTRHFSVSESGEVRSYGHLKVDTNITASGNISASGTVIASNFSGNTSGTNTGDQSLVHLAVTGSNVLFGNITSSGNISASGTTFANAFKINNFNALTISNTQGRVFADANITGIQIGRIGRIPPVDIELLGPVTASNNISASGDIIANILKSDSEVHLDGVRNLLRTSTDFFVGANDRKTEIKGTNIKLNAPVTASNNISASGNLIANEVIATVDGGTF